jgi:hypothetical protein
VILLNIIDITGSIYEGMWDFGAPGGPFRKVKE